VEADANISVGVGGVWKVSVVNASTGAEYFPFGDEFRPNLILNQGLDMLVGSSSQWFQSTSGYSQQAGTILAISTARCGTSSTAAAASQTGLQAATAATSVTTTPGFTCLSTRDTVSGFSTFTRSFDFDIVTSGVTLYEAALSADGTNSGGSGSRIFTRFVFPSPGVSLVAGQFLRLVYSLKCSIPSTVTPITVTVNNGGFTGDGSVQAVGTFAELFGTLNSDGTYVDSGWHGQKGYLPAGWASSSLYAHAYMVSSAASFPSVDTAASLSIVGSLISVAPNITSTTYSAGSGTRDITYIFPANNPGSDTSIGGVLFNSASMTGTHSRLTDGWLWLFDSPQTKHATKSLVINLTTTLTRV